MKRREFLIATAALSACSQNKFILSDLKEIKTDFPFRVFLSPGENARAAYSLLSAAYPESSSAVVLGPSSQIEYWGDASNDSEPTSPKAILSRARSLVFPEGFRNHLKQQHQELLGSIAEGSPLASMLNEDMEFESAKEVPIGPWPDVSAIAQSEPVSSITTNWETGLPHPEIAIGLVPTNDWTEIPAFLNFGGWNACPPPEWHVAALRYWRDKWGARLFGLTNDVMELQIERRPQTRQEANDLAREHYDYCSDIVEQGVGDLATLAQILHSTNSWSFWWD